MSRSVRLEAGGNRIHAVPALVHGVLNQGQAAEFSLLAALGWLALWLLRLGLAPRSTAAGFRTLVVEECPVAPGRRAAPAAIPLARPALPSGTASRSLRRSGGTRDGETKTARFLALVTEEHGPLAGIPPASVARICAVSAPLVGLNAGSARTALRRAVLSAQQQAEADQQNSLKGDL